MAAPGIGFEQDVVAEHVELLLRLALHVAGAGIAEHAAQGALAHSNRNALAGARNDSDQLAQFRIDTAGVLLFDQEASQRGTRHGNGQPV